MSEIYQAFNSGGMAQPGGHYSHAIKASGFVFISGQLLKCTSRVTPARVAARTTLRAPSPVFVHRCSGDPSRLKNGRK